MDPTTLQLLADKDRQIASLTQANVELKDQHTKLADKYAELNGKYDELSNKNASLEEEAARLRERSSPEHTASSTSTLQPHNTVITTPSPCASAPTREDTPTGWGPQSPSCDPVWATGQEPQSTLLNNGDEAGSKREEFKATLREKWSSGAAVFDRVVTKLADPSTYTFRWKQGAADPSEESSVEESVPTYWNQSGPTAWDQPAPAPEEEPKWRSLKQPPKTTLWLHRRWWSTAQLLVPGKLEDILDQHALVPATRLNDGDWVHSELRNVRVDDKYLFQLATRGKEIAQYIVYDHASKNHPSLRARRWPGGPHQVKLEVIAMSDAVGSMGDFFRWRENDRYMAQDLLFNKVVNLRHMVAHWEHLQGRKTAQFIATHLENVQKFVITMGNY